MLRTPRWRFRFLPVVLTLLLGLGLSPVTSALSIPLLSGVEFSQVAADDDKGNGKDDKEDKDKEKDKKNKNGTSEQTSPVTASAGYTIDLQCLYQEVDDHTTCTFTGVALEGAKKVNHLVVPADALCAEVLGSDARFVDPDPITHVTGYRTPGSTASTAIVLAGQVIAEGKATYWFKSGGNVFPVTGPGLTCTEDAPAAAAPTDVATEAPAMTPTPDVTDSSGAVLVQVYQCPIAGADAVGDDYDWYGACTPGGDHTFALSGNGSDGQTQSTSNNGQTQFGSVAPGRYSLTLTEGSWCHAEADEVDAEGNVIVSAGEQTTVWIFTCTAV